MYFYLALTFPPWDAQFNALVLASFVSLPPSLSQPGVSSSYKRGAKEPRNTQFFPF